MGTSTGTRFGTDHGIRVLFGSGVSIRFFLCVFRGTSIRMLTRKRTRVRTRLRTRLHTRLRVTGTCSTGMIRV